jgi:hypothetical protein
MMHLEFSVVRRRLHARLNAFLSGGDKPKSSVRQDKKLGIAISRLDDQLIL